MKIAACQFAVSGDIRRNAAKIKNALDQARQQGVQLAVFPECCLTGYPPRDIKSAAQADFDLIRDMCREFQSLADASGPAFVIGSIYRDQNGNPVNRAILFQPGQPVQYYDKRALWGWDSENFVPGKSTGVFILNGIRIGIRICFEVRFPEYFRELYKEKTDLNLILFYDAADTDDRDRYDMIKGHIRTRAVENVCTTVSVNTVYPYQTAPTAVFGRSGQILAECSRNTEGMIVYDFEKTEDNFGELGRRTISDSLTGR